MSCVNHVDSYISYSLCNISDTIYHDMVKSQKLKCEIILSYMCQNPLKISKRFMIDDKT